MAFRRDWGTNCPDQICNETDKLKTLRELYAEWIEVIKTNHTFRQIELDLCIHFKFSPSEISFGDFREILYSLEKELDYEEVPNYGYTLINTISYLIFAYYNQLPIIELENLKTQNNANNYEKYLEIKIGKKAQEMIKYCHQLVGLELNEVMLQNCHQLAEFNGKITFGQLYPVQNIFSD
jgi:hypothetical protein